jgi:hypothetical protein
VLIFTGKRSLLPAISLGPSALVALLSVSAACQTPNPTAPAPPAIQLTPYTAPDQSASAGVPSGWQVTLGQNTVIQMTGPQGETVFLGSTMVASNGAFRPGLHPAPGIDLAMPYAAPLPQKLIMILQHGAALSGKPVSPITVDSSTPLQIPPTIAQCGRFVADTQGPQGPVKFLAVLCSLPLDSGGLYKNIMLLAQAPGATAAQSAPTAQAIFRSYRIPATWLQNKLAPFTPPAVAAGAAAMINRSTIISAAGANNSANCFDLSVLRETPTYDLPRSCGGTRPD